MADLPKKISDALYAGILGDILGIPIDLAGQPPETLEDEATLCSVKNLLGYGRYDLPDGTWSDDTSLTLCTMESLSRGYDIQDMGKTFCKWLFDSKWTPSGYVFDAGLTTFIALEGIRTSGLSALNAGGVTEDDNGNGSLMRILPAALYFSVHEPEEFLTRIHEISSITHAHPRAKLGCGLFALLIRALLHNTDHHNAYRQAMQIGTAFYGNDAIFRGEISHYQRILSTDLLTLDQSQIHSSGYVVDTLESAIWAFLRHTTTTQTIIAAVEMGSETDTTGMVAGGLAGLHFGLAETDESRLASLSRREEIDTLIATFVTKTITYHSLHTGAL